MSTFPHDTWLYSPEPKLFLAGEAQPEGDWRDSPAGFGEPAPEPTVDATPTLSERDSIIAQLQTLGADFDGRWGIAKLRAALEKAAA